MLSVINKPNMPSVVMLSVITLCAIYTECHLCCVINKPNMPSVVMLIVIRLCVIYTECHLC
jgi:hypothetical protein